MDAKKLGAEFFGTFWLVLGGCGSAVLAAAFPEVGIGLLGVSLAFGLTVLTIAIGHKRMKEVLMNTMKPVLWTAFVLVLGLTVVQAEEASESDQQKTLSTTLGIYVFPEKDQSAEQQSLDEVGCYEWAVKQTGSDPFELKKQAEQQKAQAEELQAQKKSGKQKRGLRGRRQKKKQAKQQQAVDQAQQASAETLGKQEEFKKAFSACLEAKDYTVK
jgi:hypothetical protein